MQPSMPRPSTSTVMSRSSQTSAREDPRRAALSGAGDADRDRRGGVHTLSEHGLSPKQRRRYVTTTDSDHDEPIFPNLAADMAPDGPNQLWVADITYVAIATGFVYLAAILDAWSRRVVGYAISRSAIDARLTMAALSAAVRCRAPPTGCVHNSDRG